MATAKCTYPVGAWTFVAELPATIRPTAPERPLFAAEDLQRFEREIARQIVERGLRSPETLSFLRKQAGVSLAQLAELLDSNPETISRWENGRVPFSLATWQTVAALAMDEVDGKRDTASWLREAQAPHDGGEIAVAFETGAR